MPIGKRLKAHALLGGLQKKLYSMNSSFFQSNMAGKRGLFPIYWEKLIKKSK
jgi:hypothetical protein